MDIELFYTKAGSGPPLLLLHGNGEDGTYFVHQVKEFFRDFTVYTIDTRGHGRSPRGTAPFTISQFADDLLAFMDEQGLKQADILGFSDGGNIALTFALRHPDRVRRLILNGANMNPRGVKRFYQIPIEIGYKLASRAAKKHPDAVKQQTRYERCRHTFFPVKRCKAHHKSADNVCKHEEHPVKREEKRRNAVNPADRRRGEQPPFVHFQVHYLSRYEKREKVH